MSPQEQAAWELLCEETKYDMHQYDFWEDVPERVQKQYMAFVSWMF